MISGEIFSIFFAKVILKNPNNPDENSCLYSDSEAAVLKEMPTI